jgi:hypothetical protein
VIRRVVTALVAALTVAVLACGVTGTNAPNPCTGSVPGPCNMIGECVLDSDQYITGQFPSTRQFIIHTDNAQLVTFSFQFNDRVSAGTMLTLTSFEPDCNQQSSYTSMGDLFTDSGASGVLSFPITMQQPGDHLITFSSDSYCSYDLSYQ